MPTEVDELEKYAKPASASADDELEKYAKKPVATDTMYHGEEEASPANALESKTEKENLTPRMRAAVSSGAAKIAPLTRFETEHTPQETGVWNRIKQYGGDLGRMAAGLGDTLAGPVVTPGRIADIAGSYASRAVPNKGQEGLSGARSPVYNAIATGAQAAGIDPTGMEASGEHGDPIGVLTHAAAQATPVAAAELARTPVGRRAISAIGDTGGLIRPIKGALADKFATPAVAPGLSEAATANLEEPIARRGVEKVLRSSGMPSGNTGLRESFTIAAPDLAEIEREQPLGESGKKGGIIRPDMRLRQTVDNIDNRLDKLWKEERQPQIDRNAELPALSREQLLGDASIDQLKRIEKAFKMEIPDQINLGDADKMLVKVNARLRRAEGMTPEARALALELSPDLQKFNEMKGELHQAIGDLLERVNEPGIKEFNRRYRALSEVRDALRNKMNPVEAERVLDSVRATGGLGRNVNLFERLHLKASPGRLAQKGLEDLAQSGLQITPPEERPPVAGFLPPTPTPAGGPVDTSGSVRGGRYTTAKALFGEIPPIQGEYLPPEAPQAGTQPPVIHPIEAPAGVQSPFRVEAPRMRSGTIPPIEAPSSSTILPGGAAVREMKMLPGTQLPKIETAPESPAAPETKPLGPVVAKERTARIAKNIAKLEQGLGGKIPAIGEPKTGTFKVPTTKPIVPPDIEPVLKDSGWRYKGKDETGYHTIEEPGTNIKVRLLDRDLNPDFVRRKIAEKEKQFGGPETNE